MKNTMLNKKVVLFILLIIFVVIGYFFNNFRINLLKSNTEVKEKLESYYQVYKNHNVIFLRQAFNSYLSNDSSQVCILEGAVKEDHRSGIVSGLDSFSKDYYKSKFIVATIDKNKEIGDDIQIIFQKKPDRIFYTWVGKNPQGETCLIGFNSKENFNKDDMDKLIQKYQLFISDSEHSM